MTRSYITRARIARPDRPGARPSPAPLVQEPPAQLHRPSTPPTVQRVQALQRTVGNQAVCRILNGPDDPQSRRRTREGGQLRLQREPTNKAFEEATAGVENAPDRYG